MVHLLVLSVPTLSSPYDFCFLWCKTAYVVLNFNWRGVSSLRLYGRFIHFHFSSHRKVSRPERCYWMLTLSQLISIANFSFHCCVGPLRWCIQWVNRPLSSYIDTWWALVFKISWRTQSSGVKSTSCPSSNKFSSQHPIQVVLKCRFRDVRRLRQTDTHTRAHTHILLNVLWAKELAQNLIQAGSRGGTIRTGEFWEEGRSFSSHDTASEEGRCDCFDVKGTKPHG